MIELVRHIESLLLENDCVIVPDFGGFIAHHSTARWIEDEGLFLPPVRSIGFNPQLKINDGLLVQSYMQAHDTDFSDATRMMEQDIAKLIKALHEDGNAEIHGIGEINYTIDGTFEFKPNEDGMISPSLYGLSSFGIKELKAITASQNDKYPIPENMKSTKDVYEIKINRSLIRHIAAAAVAIIAFFFLSTPVENTYIENENYAGLLSAELFETIRSQSIATTLIPVHDKEIVKQQNKKNIPNSLTKDNQAAMKAVVSAKKTVPANLKPKAVRMEKVASPLPAKAQVQKVIGNKSADTSVNNGAYNIVVASVVNKSDAEKIAADYQKQGYSQATIIEGNNRVRVSLMSFSDKNEANRKIQQLKTIHSFKDAWLLTNK